MAFQDIAIDKLERRGLSNTACRTYMPGKDVKVDAILAIEGGI